MKVEEYHLAAEMPLWGAVIGLGGGIVFCLLTLVFACAISREGAEKGFAVAFKESFKEGWTLGGFALVLIVTIGAGAALGANFDLTNFRDQAKEDLKAHYKLDEGVEFDHFELDSAFKSPDTYIPVNRGRGIYLKNREGVLTKLDLVLYWDEKNRMMELYEPSTGGKEYVEFAR